MPRRCWVCSQRAAGDGDGRVSSLRRPVHPVIEQMTKSLSSTETPSPVFAEWRQSKQRGFKQLLSTRSFRLFLHDKHAVYTPIAYQMVYKVSTFHFGQFLNL